MSSHHPSRRSVLSLLLACGGASALPAQPSSRTLVFVVPQPAGNPTDGVARKLVPLLQQALGQNVVVENVPGAGGSIGVGKLLVAPASQPMLLVASQTEPILTPLALAGVRYKAEELRPVALVARGPYVLAGRPDLPATTLSELNALGRQPGAKPLSLGHIGAGSMIHLLGEQWGRKADVPLTLVPYRGVPPVVQDLMGGQIDLTFLPLGGSTATLIESGKVRAYGTTTLAQVARLPKVPPLSKQDSRLGDFNYGTWAGVFIARSVPEASAQRIHEAIALAMKDAEFRAYVVAGGTEPAAPMGLEELDRFYEAETRIYGRLAREVGITPQ